MIYLKKFFYKIINIINGLYYCKSSIEWINYRLKGGDDSKLIHYVVKESIEDDKVKYNLKEFKGKKIDEKSLINELKQHGGKHKHKYHDDSSSSSSSSSSVSSKLLYTFPAGKISTNILTYYPTIYGVPNVMLPSFSYPFTIIRLLNNALVVYPNISYGR